MIPLCSYAKELHLQAAFPARNGQPVMLRLIRLLGCAGQLWGCPAGQLVQSQKICSVQLFFVRKVPMVCIARVLPLCQEGSHFSILALCIGWVCDLLLVLLCNVTACWTASLVLADPGIRCSASLVAADITKLTNRLIAVGHHAVKCSTICLIVPLRCQQGRLGGQGVVLAHFLAAALRAARAIAPVGNSCLPAVQVPIWTLITYPSNFPAIVGCDVDVIQVSIGSMVPLLLKSWIKAADIWAFLLYTCMLALT